MGGCLPFHFGKIYSQCFDLEKGSSQLTYKKSNVMSYPKPQRAERKRLVAKKTVIAEQCKISSRGYQHSISTAERHIEGLQEHLVNHSNVHINSIWKLFILSNFYGLRDLINQMKTESPFHIPSFISR